MSDKPEPTNKEIKARNGSKKWNAFYSGQLVQEYKRRGGKKTKPDGTKRNGRTLVKRTRELR